MLAAWSLELERGQPGALARASRQLARSAELPAHTPASRRPVSRASGLALIMLTAGRPENPVGWVLVCRELGLLATEIGRVHRARGELDRAREIETDLRGELERLRAGLEAGRPAAAELDAETQTARQATKPLDPSNREPPDQAADVEAVKRLTDSARRPGLVGGEPKRGLPALEPD